MGLVLMDLNALFTKFKLNLACELPTPLMNFGFGGVGFSGGSQIGMEVEEEGA